jgi:hypothetical protein
MKTYLKRAHSDWVLRYDNNAAYFALSVQVFLAGSNILIVLHNIHVKSHVALGCFLDSVYYSSGKRCYDVIVKLQNLQHDILCTCFQQCQNN